MIERVKMNKTGLCATYFTSLRGCGGGFKEGVRDWRGEIKNL